MNANATFPVQAAPVPSPVAVASIILSMGLLAIGNGLLFAFVPVKLAAEGFPPWVAASIVTALAAGAFAGCLTTGPLIRRVGHARVFACMAAGVILSVLALCVGTVPLLWIGARALYGAASAGIFIVAQSWLNDVSENEWRGKVVAIFYMTYVMGLGLGGFALRAVELDSLQAPLLSILFATLAILPVGLTRLRTPPPPHDVSIALRKVWRISPVGLAGLLAVGGLTMMVQGFAPIYAAAEGYSKDDIALLVFLMQFGMLAIQYPLGSISDRIDRRYVLIAACVIVIASAGFATRLDGADLAFLIVTFAVWAGATETIYSVATAHANDRADPQYYVSLSSTLLIAWSVSGFVIPGVTTALTPLLGPETFMFVAIAIAVLYGLFVAYRLTRRDAVPEEDTEPYQQISAQAPLTSELAPQYDEE